MHAISLWLVTYAIPAFATGGIIWICSRYKSNARRNALIIHAGLLTSILASQYALHTFGLTFPWRPQLISLVIFGGGVALALWMFGVFGLWYALSAFLQQLTILSVSFLLFSFLSLPIVLMLVVPIYVLGHVQDVRHRSIRIILISLWGVLSIVLFSILPDIYFLAALHTLLGAIGIRRQIVYPA